MITRFKNRLIDHIRLTINDKDGLIFNDDELDSLIERFTDQVRSGSTTSFFSNKSKIGGCCCGPYKDITITSGDDEASYLIDEVSGTVWFDADDPDNLATAPADGSSISVTYWGIKFNEMMSEICFIISNSMTKLAVAQSISGFSIDSTQLSRQYWDMACRWASE